MGFIEVCVSMGFIEVYVSLGCIEVHTSLGFIKVNVSLEFVLDISLKYFLWNMFKKSKLINTTLINYFENDCAVLELICG